MDRNNFRQRERNYITINLEAIVAISFLFKPQASLNDPNPPLPCDVDAQRAKPRVTVKLANKFHHQVARMAPGMKAVAKLYEWPKEEMPSGATAILRQGYEGGGTKNSGLRRRRFLRGML